MKLKNIKLEAAKRAMAWDMGEIKKRFQKDTGVSEKRVAILERELKRFLIVAAESRTKTIGMKGPVDDLWHTFILFTKNYAKFCDQLCGHMLHHEPTIKKGEFNKMKKGDNPYVRFLKIYEVIFTEKPSDDVWPSVSKLGISCISCIECIDCIECFFQDDIPSDPPTDDGGDTGSDDDGRDEGGEGTDPDKDTDEFR